MKNSILKNKNIKDSENFLISGNVNSEKDITHSSKGWKKMKLGDMEIKIIDGDRGKNYPKKADFFKKEYCLFLNTKNVTNKGFSFSELNFITKEKDKILKAGKVKQNDVVLTTRGTIGNVVLYNEKVPFQNIRINSGMVIIRPDGINPQFNYQLFKYLKKDFLNFASGSAQPQLPIKDMKKIPVFLPPLSEQEVIAEILSSLDDKIELLHKQNKTLENIAQTLFHKWFIEDAKDDRKEKLLSDIINFNPPYNLSKGNNTPYLEMKNVNSNNCNPDDWYLRNFTSGMKFKNGDTLLARITPCLENGKTCFVSFLNENEIGWGSTEFIVMRMKESFHKFISYLIAKDSHFRYFAIKNMTGTSGRQRVQASALKNFTIKTPNKEKIQELNLQFDVIQNKLFHNSKQISTLNTFRNMLLPKLISGIVKVLNL